MAAPQLTHYDVLGIPRDADASAVRTAWKLHVQAWHPDRFSDELRGEAERQTTRINEAYSVLRDSGRRAAYDCRLAADEAAAAPDPAPRREPVFVPRAAAAPVGSPMPRTPEPQTISEQAAAIGNDAWRVVRRHPRVFAGVASAWVVVLGVAVAMSVIAGPTLPAGASQPAPRSTLVADSAHVEDLEDLADRAREEAAQADRELQALMAEDARIAAAEAAAARKAEQAAAAAARRSGGKPAPRGAGGSGKVVRVMPQAG
jgi:hypothetical protein